jgi:hypothetical protein
LYHFVAAAAFCSSVNWSLQVIQVIIIIPLILGDSQVVALALLESSSQAASSNFLGMIWHQWEPPANNFVAKEENCIDLYNQNINTSPTILHN